MATELDALRRASDRNWQRMHYVEKVLYRLMLALDHIEDIPTDIRNTVEYNNASRILGWNVDWEELYNGRF
jgi:hypothetical protein